MKTAVIWTGAMLVLSPAAGGGDTGTDPANRYAWAENAGWINAAPTGSVVTVRFDGTAGFLSGFAWGENIGWIKFGSNFEGPYSNSSSTDWGVNLDSAGNLSGFAWGENVGWIRFDPALGGVSIDPATGRFAGHAWGENIGWLKFSGASPDYGVRTLAFDPQPLGTPNWWLDHFGVTENHDAGDGVPAWRKYVMDTDPNTAGDYLRISSVSNSPSGTSVSFAPASVRRHYSLARLANLTSGGWSNVAGQAGVPGSGGTWAFRDTNTASRMMFRVDVRVSP